MARLAWMTDIHLNFLGTSQIEAWLNGLKEAGYDALLITGDIGEAHSLSDYLIRIAKHLAIPIYFVLGNHDYYHSSIDSVRKIVKRLDHEVSTLHWLPLHGIIQLNETSALLGHGGWSDGGYGDFLRSSLMLNDYLYIQELAGISPSERLLKIRALGQEGAVYLKRTLPKALQNFKQVYIALHSPPFQEAAWYEGRTPDDKDPYLPHFTCKAIGDILLDLADKYPDTQMTVLCGHTHGSGETLMRPNLQVITAGAEYNNPVVARVFEY